MCKLLETYNEGAKRLQGLVSWLRARKLIWILLAICADLLMIALIAIRCSEELPLAWARLCQGGVLAWVWLVIIIFIVWEFVNRFRRHATHARSPFLRLLVKIRSYWRIISRRAMKALDGLVRCVRKALPPGDLPPGGPRRKRR